MIKNAMKYLIDELSKPNIHEIRGEVYTDKTLKRINHNPKAERIEMSTLTSLVEYINAGIDTMKRPMIVHVQSPTKVSLYSALDNERVREYIVTVCADLPEFRFGQFLGHEEFCINLQSKFIDNDDRALLLKFAGTVEAGSVAEYGDDGVTQKATVKTGIASKGDAIVPSPAKLQPYRTFLEVEQPVSDFVFRMRQDRSGEISCGLFEADGGAWTAEAMANVKAYLKSALEGKDGFIVIS